MSSTTEEVIRGFEVKVYDNRKDWKDRKGEITYTSSKAVLDVLNSKSSNESVFLRIILKCYSTMKKVKGEIELVKETTQLFMDERIFQLTSRTVVITDHYASYEKESVIQLAELANQLTRRGAKFEELILVFKKGSSIIEEEFQVLTQNIDAQTMQDNLSPILLYCYKDEGEIKLLGILCFFLDFKWPVKSISLHRDSFQSSDFDWKKLKSVIENSRQQFRVTLRATSKQKAFVPILEVFSSIQDCIYLFDFENSAKLIAGFFDPSSDRWGNGSTRGKSLKIGFHKNHLRFNESNCIFTLREDTDIFFKQLSQMFEEKRMMLVENMEIEVEENLEQLVDELLLSIIYNNSLISLSVHLKNGDKQREMDIPSALKNEIKAHSLCREGGSFVPAKARRGRKSGTSLKYSRMKVMLIGNDQTEKRNTLRNILGEKFDDHISSTLVPGIPNIVSTNVHHVSFSDWKQTNFEIKKTGFFQKVDTGFKANSSAQKNTKMFDVSSNEISEEVLRRLTQNRKAKDSFAKENEKLELWNFGGHEVFYCLHHLYMHSECLYVLVVNLKEMKDNLDSEMKAINLWLQSLSLYSPDAGVVIVGTEYHEVSDEECKTFDRAILNLTRTIEVNIISAETFCFFPLDNSNSETIEAMTKPLKEMILNCFNGKIKHIQNIWNKDIPIAWMYFMNYLRRNFKGIISSKKVLQLASLLNLNKTDVISMLQFYENAGAILPFLKSEAAQVVTLGDFIVLRPDWLLKAIGTFIYDPDSYTENGRITTPALVAYEESGIVSKKLLIKVLGQSGYSEENIHIVFQLSKNLLLMSDFAFKPEWGSHEDEYMIVPAMIRQKVVKRVKKRSSVSNCYNLLVCFKRYVPTGVYERILCLMLSMNNAFDGFSMKPSVYKDIIRLYFREFPVFLVNEHENRRIRISLPKNRFGDEHNAILNIIKVVEKVILIFKSDALGKSFNPDLLFDGVITEDGDDMLVQCAWNDMLYSASKGEDIVRCIADDGEEESESLKVFHPFDVVANLAVEQQIPEAEIVKEKEDGDTLQSNYDAFITHTWGPNNETHLRVMEIKNQLERSGLRIWVDNANLSNYVAADIVGAIGRSSTVLVFITKLYLEKISNSHTTAAREFEKVSGKLGNALIPVVLEEDLLDPKTWFEYPAAFHMSYSVIYDFSTPEAIAENFEKLPGRIQTLQERMRLEV